MMALPNFQDVFGRNPDTTYSRKTIDHITKCRHELEGTLFFDRLLGTMHLQRAVSLYPPQSGSDLHRLFDAIACAAAPVHHKQSMFYYMLLDLVVPERSAAAFAQDALLPPKYETLMDGLWALDQMEFEQALKSLTYPSLIPTFAEETLLVLCKHATNSSGRDLALGYYEAITPEIRSQHVLDQLFRMMCGAGISEAFFYARTQADSMHRRLFESLVSYILNDLSGDQRSVAAVELVNLPLTNEEDSWLGDFLESGPGRTLGGSMDVMIMKSLLSGQHDRARKISSTATDQQFNGNNWNEVIRSLA